MSDARRVPRDDPPRSPAAAGRRRAAVRADDDAPGPLAWLSQRLGKDGKPFLSAAEVRAGERLRSDFWHAQRGPRVTTSWAEPCQGGSARSSGGGAGVEMLDSVLGARRRAIEALTSVGPGLAELLVDVCCLDLGLEQAEQQGGHPSRSGKVLLRAALVNLARHYGLVSPADADAGLRRRLRHWGMDDFRPSLEVWR